MSTTPPSEAQALPGIAVSIRTLRDQRAILDSDLAALYGVETKRFNEQIKRNLNRFPRDFMFQLTADEMDALRSQFATLTCMGVCTLLIMKFAPSASSVRWGSSVAKSRRRIGRSTSRGTFA